MNGKVCGICRRKTNFYYMGYHQYFCNLPPLEKKDNITEELKKDTETIEINIGDTAKWQLDYRKPGGKLNRILLCQ